MTTPFSTDEAFARRLDEADPLRHYRDRFHIPLRPDGAPVIYFCGNSLGLQPKTAALIMQQELDAWAQLAVEGHFKKEASWYSYHELFRESGARLVGARPGEVVMMNSLTVNLHLMMATFYRPTAERRKIIIDTPAFPSDLYALQAQIRHHGFDPESCLIKLEPRSGEHILRMEDIEAIIARHADGTALVWWNAVNYYTGQCFDIPRIAAAAHRQGCLLGLDLAHAAGNVILHLHDWQVDFAVWCNYKYLNSGPGAIGGCFVHEKHGANLNLPRLAGWWGNDPSMRFDMPAHFVPRPGADGWQLSNPSIFAMAPLRASFALYDEASMPALRAKSELLTGYLSWLLRQGADTSRSPRIEVITPSESAERGCQLSILVHDRPQELLQALHAEGVVCDFRAPNVIRVAPTPLYNTFHEVWRFAGLLARRV